VIRIGPCIAIVVCCAHAGSAQGVDFEREVRPILAQHCHRCHGAERQEGGLRLDLRDLALKGGDSGPAVVPRASDKSEMLRRIATSDTDLKMPPEGTPLTATQIDLIRRWIETGATWPESDADRAAQHDSRRDHWAYQPLLRPTPPTLNTEETAWARTPIDAFIAAGLREHHLAPSPTADRRTLLRRLYYDLIGLPPTPDETTAFLNDDNPQAYERLVDRLLASPHYGERWARHWLDVVHYADTHGYDKDKPRPNAWPYRDYVIRALNEDKPYARFVQEQLAGDVLFPDTVDGVEALGFIAAGPWDFIGHVEVPETKTDGKIARLLDRDDMVSTTMNVFTSLTVQCARCHNHKFDPVTQADYYGLQAVFAALDRADKLYESDPVTAARRRELTAGRTQLTEQIADVRKQIQPAAAERLQKLDHTIAELEKPAAGVQSKVAAFGYHSQVSPTQTATKWVQVNLRQATPLAKVLLYPCFDNYNNIGAGFGFPIRFKVEIGNDSTFETATTIADYTAEDFANPGVQPVEIAVNTESARYLRVTATKLAPRRDDFIFALAEVEMRDVDGFVVSTGARVTAFDNIDAPPRWQKPNLVDRYAPGLDLSRDPEELARLRTERNELIETSLDAAARQKLATATDHLADVDREIASLPAQRSVYAGTVHHGSGSFRGTGPDGGKPRPIHVLRRGDVNEPREEVGPAAVPICEALPAQFALSADAPEGERRAALARWITDARNPLTWRTIVNRVWQYHFGRGLVDTPNDFGRMGAKPSHPELLDWLAVEFRDGGGSLKQLHRLIVTSAVYRQSSKGNAAFAAIDGGNTYLWRMHRRRLEAEAIRDSVLAVAGALDRTPGGPGFQDFVITQPTHSPHYEYQLHDPNDPKSHRRAIYRFIVRSQPQPMLTTLDCADPSLSVDKRNESQTALQALALLNNRFMLTMAERFAERLRKSQPSTERQIEEAFRLALAREPTAAERAELTAYAQQFGLPSACRVLFNLSELMFVD
jgi:mono/diheme cytochrome c family protein